jgi:soluble lytic murein transglycosylase
MLRKRVKMFIAVKLKDITKYLGPIFALILTFTLGTFFLRTYFPVKYLDIISENAEKYGLDPEFICGVIRQESRFNIAAVSHKGASGLMQLMEPTAYWVAEEMGLKNFDYENILNPELNIAMGCWYINWLMERFGNEEAALLAYNAGAGRVSQWLADDIIEPQKFSLSAVPYPETRNYVKRVLFYKKVYRVLLFISQQ